VRPDIEDVLEFALTGTGIVLATAASAAAILGVIALFKAVF
jgi:hypothetical protein